MAIPFLTAGFVVVDSRSVLDWVMRAKRSWTREGRMEGEVNAVERRRSKTVEGKWVMM